MNQRFKELAEQAGFQYIKDEGIGWAGNYNASLPKFAELLVKECAQFVEDKFDFIGDEIIVKEKMLEHFGVE